MDARDRALFVKLVHGTLEYQIQIDHIIDSFSRTPVKKMKPLVRNILRMSAYQILHLDRIPDSAACNEGVKLINKTALRNLSGFVNGVLRSISRNKESIDLETPADKYSVQPWIIELLNESIGEANAKRFLEYSLEEHGVTLRRVGSDEMILLENAIGLTESPEWKEGRIIVQDRSSSMPVVMAEIGSDDLVIDVCAAPGGKSLQAAEHAREVISCDLTEKKVSKINENIERLRVKNIRTVVQDASVRREDFVSLADVVLADLPCSGLGTISKKPEIKNRLSIDDCKALADIQKKILNNVCDYVKPGGKLVFSTCTLDHYENEDNTRMFLDSHKEFELTEEKTLLPGEFPQDGFYIAVMKKNG